LQPYHWIQGWHRISLEGQFVFWTIGGALVLALAATDVWRGRDARSWLPGLWVMGTFVFTAAFNWSINGRSILPMAPAAGILLARRLESRGGANEAIAAGGRRHIVIGLAASALLALLVAGSDFVLAVAVRQSARQTYERYGHGGQTVWFQGHWGFQYYLAEMGGQAQDKRRCAGRAAQQYQPGPSGSPEGRVLCQRTAVSHRHESVRRGGVLQFLGWAAAVYFRACAAGECGGFRP
jgi:hypothetical protein